MTSLPLVNVDNLGILEVLRDMSFLPDILEEGGKSTFQHLSSTLLDDCLDAICSWCFSGRNLLQGPLNLGFGRRES